MTLKDGETDYEVIAKEYYQEYRKLGGKSSFKIFRKELNVFTDLTLDAFCYGETGVSREEAFAKWIKHIKNRKEADRYFEAVDSVTGYT